MTGVFARQKRNEKTVYSPIVIEQGTTWSMTMDITGVNGVADFDWTDFSGRGQLRRTYLSDDADAIDFTIVIDTDADTVTYSLTSVETAALDSEWNYVYDIELYNTDDPVIVYRPVQGPARIDPNVTRS